MQTNWNGVNIPFQTNTSTGNDGVAKVIHHWREGVLLDLGPESRPLTATFLVVDRGDELDTLPNGQIGPVDTLCRVAVIGTKEAIEALLFIGVHLSKILLAVHVGSVRSTRAKVRHICRGFLGGRRKGTCKEDRDGLNLRCR